MHILLTDILTCPRCGPAFGLILLADAVENRRVRAGTLGCANCREKYPISDGVVMIAAGGAAPPASPTADPAGVTVPAADDAQLALRLAALLGITEGPATVLLAGAAAAQASAVAGMVPALEVVAATAGEAAAPAGAAAGSGGAVADSGVSPVRVTGTRLPFANGSMAGVAVTGDAADRWLEEGARVLAPLGRLVVQPAPATAQARLAAAGLGVLAREDDVLVAGRTAAK